jgi:predicted DNA binding CopG/RHH family protein
MTVEAFDVEAEWEEESGFAGWVFLRPKDFSEDRLPLKKDDKTIYGGTKMKPPSEAEEKEIMDALESGAIELEKPSRKLLSDLKRASENTFKKDRRINVRLSRHDLLGIQMKALKKGLPYQTLISGLIHQYVEGDLLEKT